MGDVRVMSKHYLDYEATEKAVQAILPYLKAGDIINIGANAHHWYNFAIKIGNQAICNHQKRLFGPDSRWNEGHCVMYFGEAALFSVQPPHADMIKVRDLCLEKLTVWRFTKRKLKKNDIDIMKEAVAQMYGTEYDYGQLVNILINRILGYPQTRIVSWMDLGRTRKVCSVGLRVIYEHLRKELEKKGKGFEKLFQKLNPKLELHDPFYRDNFHGVDVEMTSPAHFSNSCYFDNEFALVAEFDLGKLIQEGPGKSI